ncbi:unnamed protein product, partial [Ectocarpus sp. 12 AP-2014]
ANRTHYRYPFLEQLQAEWRMLMEAVKTPSAHLSSFHVFVLAHVLRRPIVVYG